MSQSGDCPADHVKRLLEARLHLISKEWADDVWDEDFTDLTCDWPDELADTEGNTKYWSKILERFLETCRAWPCEQPGFWLSLVENDISPRVLIAFLYCLMEKHRKHHIGVLAAHTYLILNPVVGSNAYKIFHSLLFEKAVNFVRLLSATNMPSGRKKKAPKTGYGRAATQKRSARARVEVSDEDDDEGGGATGGGEVDPRVRDTAIHLMQDFVSLMDRFSLKASEHCLQQIIVLYAEMLRTAEPVTVSWNMDTRAILRCSSSPELAAITILKLCQAFHGAPTATILLTFKQLRPTFLMTWMTAQSGAVPPALNLSSNVAMQLVRHMTKLNQEICVQSLQILFQHLCASAPARSDLRSRLAQVVVAMLAVVSTSSRVFLTGWLRKYSKSNKTSHRVFSCDVLGQLMQHSFAPIEGELDEEDRRLLSDISLLRCIFSRCSDKAASVRSHALSVLAEVGAKFKDAMCILLQEVNASGLGACHAKVFIPMVVRRSGDEKAVVRKSALQALELLVNLSSTAAVDTEVLQALRDRCRDPALSVRKQALSSLSGLLQHRGHDSRVQELWLEAVLPMVLDRETSVKQRCCQLLHTYILEYMEHASRSSSAEHERAWSLLAHIAAEENTEMRRYFQRVVSEWAIERNLSSSLLKSLQTHTDAANSKAAWMFLAEISPHASLPSTKHVLDTWKQVDVSAPQSDLACYVLTVVAGNSQQLSASERSVLSANLLKHLLNFKSDLPLVGSMVQTLSKLTKDSIAEADAVRQPWAVKILESCQQWLTENLWNEKSSPMEERDLICRLFTLGEAVQLCPACVSEQLFLLVQSLLASPTDTQPSSSSVAHATVVSSPLVRSHAFVTLGKLCLQQESLAKKCVIVLVRELETSEDAIVRNNVVIILCDLCVRYTQLVDNYLSSISGCLGDESPLVSHQTLMSLTLLLKEDYIKWKGTLFFRYLMCIVSDNPKSCQFAEYCLVHLMLARHQILFSTQFMECLFHYNSYEKHATYNKFAQTEKDKKAFSLKGEKNRPKRRTIYQFLLQHMTDEQRFGITAKLCHEVLSGVVDSTLSLKSGGSDVLADALFVLCCPEIKLSSLRVRTADDMEDEMEQANVAAANAKSKLVTQLVRKNVMENIMPIIIDLKHMLEHKRSSLLRNLMQFLQELMKDYRNEVQDILSADRQLAREIEYDLKKFEEEEARASSAAESRPTTTQTPHTQMMSPLLATPVVDSPHALLSPAAGFSFPRVRGARAAPVTPADMLRENMRLRAAAAVTTATRTPNVGASTRPSSHGDMPPPAPGTRVRDGSPTLAVLPAVATPAKEPAKAGPPVGATPRQPANAALRTPRTATLPGPPTAQSLSTARNTLASAGPPVLARAVSTPHHQDARDAASLSFRDSIIGLIPPSPILPMAKMQHGRGAQSQGKQKTADGRPLLSIPNPQKPQEAPSQWAIASPQIPSVSSQENRQGQRVIKQKRQPSGGRSPSPQESSPATKRTARVLPVQQPVPTDNVDANLAELPSPKRSRGRQSQKAAAKDADSSSPSKNTRRSRQSLRQK